MPSLKTQALMLADYLEATDLTTAQCHPHGLGRASDLLEMLVERVSRRPMLNLRATCEAATQRIAWLRRTSPERIFEQDEQARTFDEAYPLAGVYNPKATPMMLRALAEV